MLTMTGIGRLTADPEVRKSQKSGNQFAKFNLAVNKGFGDSKKTIFLECTLHGETQVQRMLNAGVKKGSLIFVTGDFDLVEYEKKDQTKNKAPKLTLYDWNYVPSSGKPNGENAPANGANSAQPQTENTDGYVEVECNDDDLPL